MSYGNVLLATRRKAVRDWFHPKKHQGSCSDLVFYQTKQSTWRIIVVTLACKCSNRTGNICVPKCCPHNQIIEIDKRRNKTKCINPIRRPKFYQPMQLPVHSLKTFECNNSHQDVRIRYLLI